ncbi:hypothetical protein K438DRAFT_1998044 [Mycena galopus ATCC 62051]|nr:hypothetical protein K438DRAFT_1998044 [Mycena galopus ATCC 62051]
MSCSKYEAGFSAGDEKPEGATRQRIEDEMDMMGIGDAVQLGRQLDGELEDVSNPASEDNALLAEILAALDADTFDADETQADAQKSKEWYPYPSKMMLLLDICDNLPRLPVSESLMRTIIWILKQCGAKDVPSLDGLRKIQKELRSYCGVPTVSCTSVQGKNFCINDPKAIIRMAQSIRLLVPERTCFSEFQTGLHGVFLDSCPALNSYPFALVIGSIDSPSESAAKGRLRF